MNNILPLLQKYLQYRKLRTDMTIICACMPTLHLSTKKKYDRHSMEYCKICPFHHFYKSYIHPVNLPRPFIMVGRSDKFDEHI
jgi:hypothetical protein